MTAVLRGVAGTNSARGPAIGHLVGALRTAIESEDLRGGDRLPSARELAALAGVSRTTAERAYGRLADLGYVARSPRSGTFVRGLAPTGVNREGATWQHRAVVGSETSAASSVLRRAYAGQGRDDFIPLANGWPDADLFPTDRLASLVSDVFSEVGGEALAYVPHVEGLPALRAAIARRGRQRGFARSDSEILVTSGATQAVDIVMRTVVAPGEKVAIESPTTSVIASAAAAARATVVAIPTDDEGLDVERLEREAVRHDIKLVALQPSSQNPGGQDLSDARRAALLRLVRRRNMLVLEDAVYADVRYDGRVARSLREDAPDHVIYVDSISKTLGGGWRVGWVVASGFLIHRLQVAKLDGDAGTPTLGQYVVARGLDEGLDIDHVRHTADRYRARRDALVAGLRESFGANVRFTVPGGGHHLWASLAGDVDEEILSAEALGRGTSFVPGSWLLLTPAREVHLRLSFAVAEPDRLRIAAGRLARAYASALRQPGHRPTI